MCLLWIFISIISYSLRFWIKVEKYFLAGNSQFSSDKDVSFEVLYRETTGRLKTLIELTVNQVWKWQIDGTALNSSGTRGTAGGCEGVSEPQGLYCIS